MTRKPRVRNKEYDRAYVKRNAARLWAQQKARNAENPEPARERVKRWKKRHREQHKAYRRKWWSENRERLNAEKRANRDPDYYKKQEAVRRARMEADPELKARRLKSHRESYRRRRLRCIENVKLYVKKHPEKAKQYSRTTAANRRTARGTYTTAQWKARLAMFGDRCAYCDCELSLVTIHRDHVLPLRKGGTNWASNLVPSCETCNLRKGTAFWLPVKLVQYLVEYPYLASGFKALA